MTMHAFYLKSGSVLRVDLHRCKLIVDRTFGTLTNIEWDNGTGDQLRCLRVEDVSAILVEDERPPT